MAVHFKSPLTVYVLWHPEYADGAAMAERLFDVFSRNTKDPFARTPGIPVYFRSSPAAKDQVPKAIAFEESDNTAIVVLVDDHMVVSDDWNTYVADLDQAAEKAAGKVRLFPVAVNTNSFNFPVANTNFIRLFEVQEIAAPAAAESDSPQPSPAPASIRHQVPQSQAEHGFTINIFVNSKDAGGDHTSQTALTTVPSGGEPAAQAEPGGGGKGSPALLDDNTLVERRATFLIGKLVHEFSRLLYDQPRITDKGTVQSAPPVRVFISHAKADGADIAAAIRNHIHSDTSLKSFFDANDIAVGYRFSSELLAAIEESAMICVQTDHYATREWCLWEVISAKRLDRPVVVVNAVSDREPRSFPYIGNVPTIRWQFDGQHHKQLIQDILDMTLFEVLGIRFRELFQKALIKEFGLPSDTAAVGHPPELFTILKMGGDGSQDGNPERESRYVVYPDPPLGDEELGLLRQMAPRIHFVTPTMLPLIRHQIANQ